MARLLVAVLAVGAVPAGSEVAQAAFPGKNGRIAFVREGEERGIWLVRQAGGGELRLTAGEDYRPVWSPDGTRIVFGSTRDGDGDIFVMDADGRDETKLTRNRTEELKPVWSPDGSGIAFVSRQEGNVDIYLMAPDGSGLRRLTRHRSADRDPAWSPDGTRLVFASNRRGRNQDLYVIGADRSGLERLTHNSGLDWAPAWSPNGGRIVFTRARYWLEQQGLVVLDLDDRERARIAISPASELEPDWQPRQRRVG